MLPFKIEKITLKLDAPLCCATILTLLYFFFEEYLFGLPNSKNGVEANASGTFGSAIWLAALLFGLMIVFFWFLWSFKAKSGLKVIYGLIFSAAVLSQYGYWNAVHRLIKATDVALLGMTTTATWRVAFNLYFSWWGLLVCLPYSAGLIVFIKTSETDWKELAISGSFLLIASLVLAPQNNVDSLGTSFTEIFHSLGTYFISDLKPIVREKVAPIQAADPKNNIVLIIDESIRADHLSINSYHRETTPYLEKLDQAGQLYSWGTASAGATCSYLSNELIFTGILPSSKSIDIAVRSPNVFDYARAAGYKITYLDAQTDYIWNGLTTDDIGEINWINIKTLGSAPPADLNAALIIRDLVAKSTGNFIVLNKRGVHFMYEDSYPEEWDVWGPLPPQENYRQYPQLVTNPYDNGILYTVNEFFKTLLPNTNSLKNTTYLYTSDHAQTLFEDGVSWSHCNNTIKEASVPLILIGQLNSPPDLTFHAAHSNILPTILDLMDFPHTPQTAAYQSSILAATKISQKRVFIDGALRVVQFDP
jgi:glucan phosphoethanolaminetransferase (alkaline phosphatase superfamily)